MNIKKLLSIMVNDLKTYLFIFCLFIVSCHDKEEKNYGFLEGRYLYLSCEYSGNLTDLFVKRGQSVTQGQPLFKIDDQEEEINVKLLQKDIEKYQINIDYATYEVNIDKINLNRKISLNDEKRASNLEVDKAKNQLNISQEKFELAKKNLNEATLKYRLELLKQSKKLIKSPKNGFIADSYYSKGEFASAASPVLSLLPEDQMMAVFLFLIKKYKILKEEWLLTFIVKTAKRD